jgi:hypothetical protein
VHEIASTAALGEGARCRRTKGRFPEHAHHGGPRRFSRKVDLRIEDISWRGSRDEDRATLFSVDDMSKPVAAGNDGRNFETKRFCSTMLLHGHR